MDFFTYFLWSILKDILQFFLLFLLWDWIADRLGMNRFEKAWLLSLITVGLLTLYAVIPIRKNLALELILVLLFGE